MPEKEIDINAVNPVNPSPKPTESAVTYAKKPTIDVPKGATALELVDMLLQKPTDELMPWEKTRLPSMGLFYQGRIPNGEVEVRPMGLTADKILATSRLTQSGQAIDKIFEHCVKFPDNSFDPMDLLTGDRTFLLFYLRGITHGNWYEFQLVCPNEDCGILNSYDYDLNLLSGTIKHPKCSQEPIRITLPYLSEVCKTEFWVEARLLRGRDITNMGKNKKMQDKVMGGKVLDKSGKPVNRRGSDLDETIEQNLNMVLTSVLGVTDRRKVEGVIKKLHARDSAVIRETLRDVAPGLDTQITIKCPDCNTEINIDLPITESFFRPKDSGGVRE